MFENEKIAFEMRMESETLDIFPMMISIQKISIRIWMIGKNFILHTRLVFVTRATFNTHKS